MTWLIVFIQNLQLPISSSAPTPESILILRRKLQETRKLNHALRSTNTRNTALISQLNELLSPRSSTSHPSLAFLASHSNSAAQSLNLSLSPSTKDSKPLTTNAQFAASQLPALRRLVNELKPKMQNLRDGAGANIDWESKREERRAYIEVGARKIVGKGAAEGEGISGERRGREEVEGLEKLVTGLDKGRGDRMEE